MRANAPRISPLLAGLAGGALAAWLGLGARRLGREGFRRTGARDSQRLELLLRNEVLRRAQSRHLAAPLFSLDEILIPARVLLPPPRFDPDTAAGGREFERSPFPEVPDWPELAALSTLKWASLAEALSGGASLILTGLPGSGKTVALAHLASQLARRDEEVRSLGERLPLLVHAGDFAFPAPQAENPLQALISALFRETPPVPLPQMLPWLESVLREGKAMLLLDGMDELPAQDFERAAAGLKTLLGAYPRLQVVTTALPDYYPGLVALGFIPVSIAAWEEEQRRGLIARWSQLWRDHFSSPETAAPVDPAILEAWLLQETSRLSPLELTLKAWAAFAGDSQGPRVEDALEAYVLRMTSPGGPERLRLSAWAVEALLDRSAAQPSSGLEADEPALAAESGAGGAPPRIESGLVQRGRNGRYFFSHPTVAGYLAAAAGQAPLQAVLAQPGAWSGKAAWLYYAARAPEHRWAQTYLEGSSPPLQQRLLAASRWLNGDPQTPWQRSALRWLALLAQNSSAPFGLRLRAVAGLAHSDSSGINALFKGFLKSPEAALRQLGAIGAGLLGEAALVEGLIPLLYDPSLDVSRTAALALVRLGGKAAIEAVASSLLGGEESTRRAAAEALAADPVEGQPLLKEGLELQDLLVRRAALYGLRRVRKPWAVELIQKVHIEDSEWVVKNTAEQILEELALEEEQRPRIPPDPSELPWLIAFAGRRGMGIAPGRAAQNLLLTALSEGDQAEKLAALESLRQYGEARAVEPVQELLESGSEELRAAAFETLWSLSAQGYI